MENNRLDKINRLLQKELGELLRQETAKTHGIIVSVSAVRTAPDLSFARAYLSIFPSERGQDILANVNRTKGELRYALAQKVRHQLRVIPELAFEIDDSLDYLERIDQLLKR